MMRKTVLIYNFPEGEEEKLRRLAGGSARVLPVQPLHYGIPLSELLDENRKDRGKAERSKEVFGERMMVFGGFEEENFDGFLSALREAKIGIGALKAVLTPTNALWTSEDLYRELAKEREAFFRLREGQKPWR